MLDKVVNRLSSKKSLENWTPVPHTDIALKYHLGNVYQNTRPKDHTPEEYEEIGQRGLGQGKDIIFGTDAMHLAEGKRKEDQAKHDVISNMFQQMLHNGGIQVLKHSKTGNYAYRPTDSYNNVMKMVLRPGKEQPKRSRQFDKPTQAEKTDFDKMMAGPGSSMTQQEVEGYWAKQHKDNQVYTPEPFGAGPRGKMGYSGDAAATRSVLPENSVIVTGTSGPGKVMVPRERVTPTNPTSDVGSIPAPLPAGVEGPIRIRKPDVVRPGEIGPAIPESTGGTSLPVGAGIFTPGGPGLYDIEKKKARAVDSAARKMRKGLQQVTARPQAAEEVAAEANLRAANKEARTVEARQKTIETAQGTFVKKLAQEQIKHVFNPNKPEQGHHFFDISEGDTDDAPHIETIPHNVWINKDWGGREADDVGLSQVDNAGNETRQKSEAETYDPKNIWDSLGSYRESVKLIQKHMQETHNVEVPVKHMMSWFRANNVLPKLWYKCDGKNCGDKVFEESELNSHTHDDDDTKPTFVSRPDLVTNKTGGGGSMWPARAVDATVNIIRQLRNSQQDINLPANPNKGRDKATVVPKEPVITYGPEIRPVKDESGAVMYKPCSNTKGVKGVNSGEPCSVATAAIKGKQKAQVGTDKICPGCTKPREVLTAPTGRKVRKEVRPEGGQSAVKLPSGWQRFSLQGLADHSVLLSNTALATKVSNITAGRQKAAETRKRGGRKAADEMNAGSAVLDMARDAAGTATPLSPPNSDGDPTPKNHMGHWFDRNGEHSPKCNQCRIDAGNPSLKRQLENRAERMAATEQSVGEVKAHFEDLQKLESEGHTLKEVDVTKNTAPITGDPMRKMLSRRNPKYGKFHDETSCPKCKENTTKAGFEPTEEPRV